MERKRLDDTRLSFLDAMGIPPARVEVYYLIDFRTQEPVDILPNRHKEELIRYFRSIPWEERKRVKAVCIDTYPVYRDAIRTAFPEDVKICVDHFHLIKELDRLPSSVNGLSRINSASNNAILESGREAPYVQEIAVQRPDFC